jgi:hypothetical protein
MKERALRSTPSPYPGALAWSPENLLAVGQERSVIIVVRGISCAPLLTFSSFPSRCLLFFRSMGAPLFLLGGGFTSCAEERARRAAFAPSPSRVRRRHI